MTVGPVLNTTLWVYTWANVVFDTLEMLAICCTIAYLTYSQATSKKSNREVKIPPIVKLQLILLFT